MSFREHADKMILGKTTRAKSKDKTKTKPSKPPPDPYNQGLKYGFAAAHKPSMVKLIDFFTPTTEWLRGALDGYLIERALIRGSQVVLMEARLKELHRRKSPENETTKN